MWHDLTDYPNGYVDGRFVSRQFVLEAAERGSEPTRYSFIGAAPLHSTDPAIIDVLPRIPVYPEAEREKKMNSFYVHMMMGRYNFGRDPWNRLQKLEMVTSILHFGARLILANSRILYRSRQRLWEEFAACPDKPAGIVELGEAFLGTLANEEKEAFCQAIQDYLPKPDVDWLSVVLEDIEMAWFNRTIDVGEW